MNQDKDKTVQSSTEPAPPSPTADAKPAEPKAAKPKPKGPGRPKGSKNAPKAGTKPPPKQRKAPKDYKDTAAAEKKARETLNAIRAEHNKKYPNANWKPAPEPKRSDGPPAPVVPAAQLEGALEAGCGMLGGMWKVETRPDPKAIKECAKAWSAVSGYFAVDPRTMAITAAVSTTFVCVLPMYLEKRARDRGDLVGELPPHPEEKVTNG